MIRSATGFKAWRTCVVAALALWPAVSSAQPSPAERAQAEALFNDGRKLFKEGKTEEACRKLEASYRIDPAGGTVLNLALCHEKEGKIASAWTEFKEALAAAKKASRRDREKIARERIDAIEPKLPYMVVIPDKPDVTGLTVTVDDHAIEREAWGAQIPVDPGKHTVKASAPEREPWEGPFTAEEGKKVTVRVPGLAVAVPTATASASATAPPVLVPKYPWMRPSGIAIASVGVAALVVGAVFGGRAVALAADAKKGCDPTTLACDDAGFKAVEDGRTSATASEILIGVGGGLAAVGVVLFIVGGAKEPASPATVGVSVAPLARISANGATLGLEGAW